MQSILPEGNNWKKMQFSKAPRERKNTISKEKEFSTVEALAGRSLRVLIASVNKLYQLGSRRTLLLVNKNARPAGSGVS